MEFGPGSNPTALTAAPAPTPSLDIIPLYVFSAGSFLLCGLLGGGGVGRGCSEQPTAVDMCYE